MHTAGRALLLVLAAAAIAPLHAAGPDIPETASRDIDFVPKGWKLYDKAEGDLNGDGTTDSVLVIQENDPNKVIDNPDGFGVDHYAANQRILLFVLSDADYSFRLAGRDDLVIPDRNSPTIDDPYSGLAIKDGKATLFLRFWASAGSWYMSSHQFHFRWDGKAMQVIGYDGLEVHRASGVLKEVSVNYLTGRRKDVVGSISDDSEQEGTWSKVAPGSKPKVGSIGNGFDFLPFPP